MYSYNQHDTNTGTYNEGIFKERNLKTKKHMYTGF